MQATTQKYRKAIGDPLLIFFMALDGERGNIPGINRGRIALLDDGGVIGRWVFSSSTAPKQSVNDWNKIGGIMPPTTSMPGGRYWEFHTQRLIRPGMAVDDGFLITFDGNTEYTTIEGGTRSELFVHNDVNRVKAEGTFGCPFTFSDDEWQDFCTGIFQSVSHKDTIRFASLYCY
jgi:hypothetical protein